MAGYAVADPDLHIREGGGGGVQKQIFRPFGPHFALNIRGAGGGRGLPGPFPESAADMGLVLFAFL